MASQPGEMAQTAAVRTRPEKMKDRVRVRVGVGVRVRVRVRVRVPPSRQHRAVVAILGAAVKEEQQRVARRHAVSGSRRGRVQHQPAHVASDVQPVNGAAHPGFVATTARCAPRC